MITDNKQRRGTQLSTAFVRNSQPTVVSEQEFRESESFVAISIIDAASIYIAFVYYTDVQNILKLFVFVLSCVSFFNQRIPWRLAILFSNKHLFAFS